MRGQHAYYNVLMNVLGNFLMYKGELYFKVSPRSSYDNITIFMVILAKYTHTKDDLEVILLTMDNPQYLQILKKL